MSCEEAFLVEDTGAYNITLRLDLDSAFTPAIIDVINSVEIQRFRSDMAGIIEIPTLIVVRNATQVTVNQTILHNEIIPTEAGEQFYVYIVSRLEAYVHVYTGCYSMQGHIEGDGLTKSISYKRESILLSIL